MGLIITQHYLYHTNCHRLWINLLFTEKDNNAVFQSSTSYTGIALKQSQIHYSLRKLITTTTIKSFLPFSILIMPFNFKNIAISSISEITVRMPGFEP